MLSVDGVSRPGRIRNVISLITAMAAVMCAGSCRWKDAAKSPSSSVVLRVGFPQASSTSTGDPRLGFRQVNTILSVEGLARTGEDGRMQPSLAEGWTLASDRRSLTVRLRPNATFHDGSPLDSSIADTILPKALSALMGPVFADIDHVRAFDPRTIEIAFRGSSPLLIESLDASIQKPNGVATGAYAAASDSATDMVANERYYLGPPTIRTVHVENYPSVRAAWAEMLRGNIDMLWEVGPDALSSMQNSSTVSLFTFTRRYQFVIVLNPDAPVLRSPDVRRALNMGVDRAAIVRNALNGYGVASSGPVWPRYWALKPDLPKFGLDAAAASKLLGRSLKLTCLVPPDAPFERIALEVKRQLAAIGVELILEEVSHDELSQRAGKRQYEALLTELLSGPTLFRPYLVWHSKATYNYGQFGTPVIDIALDRVRRAPSDDAYRQSVAGLHQAFMDDPPAVFLAWSVRARAVSKRFIVPTPEAGREILSTLRLWKPTEAGQQASRN